MWGMTKHHRALPLGMAWRAAKIPAHQEKAAPSGSLRWKDEELGTMWDRGTWDVSCLELLLLPTRWDLGTQLQEGPTEKSPTWHGAGAEPCPAPGLGLSLALH